MWARGYFCATVGAVDEATIKAYIESQKWDEDDPKLQDHSAQRVLSRFSAGAALRRLQPHPATFSRFDSTGL